MQKATSLRWTKAKDITLCKQVVKERPYDHPKGSGDRGNAWKKIALTLLGVFEQKVSDRAVRGHTEDLIASFKSEESEELRSSGIVPEYTEKEVTKRHLEYGKVQTHPRRIKETKGDERKEDTRDRIEEKSLPNLCTEKHYQEDQAGLPGLVFARESRKGQRAKGEGDHCSGKQIYESRYHYC